MARDQRFGAGGGGARVPVLDPPPWRERTSLAAGAAGRSARFGCAGHAAERLDDFVGRRQVGREGDADQHHLGRRQRIGRLAGFLDALEQHLPDARKQRDRQARAESAARRFSSPARPSPAGFGADGLDARGRCARPRQGRPAPGSARRRRDAGLRAPASAALASPATTSEQIEDAAAVGEAEHGAHASRRVDARPSPMAMAWSSIDSASRTEPSAARAISASASSSRWRLRWRRSWRGAAASRHVDAAQVEALAARQHRHRDLADLGRREDELHVLGGSSSVFRSALNAPFDSMWTSSMMKTLVRATSGL